MKAIQIVDLSRSRRRAPLVELPEPEPSHPLTPGRVLVSRCTPPGVSFPEVLRPAASTSSNRRCRSCRAARWPGWSSAPGRRAGQGRRSRRRLLRARRLRRDGRAPEFLTFELAGELDFAQGAALILNYHTAYFALVMRGRLKAGRDGARPRCGRRRGNRGAAGRQGPRRDARSRSCPIDPKQRVAERAGADHVVRSGAVEGRGPRSSPAAAWTWCSTP